MSRTENVTTPIFGLIEGSSFLRVWHRTATTDSPLQSLNFRQSFCVLVNTTYLSLFTSHTDITDIMIQ